MRTLTELFTKRKELAHAYQRTFDTPHGQMVLRDLLRKGGILETSHEPGDAYTTAWRDGRRSLALELVEALRWTEGELVALAQEQTADQIAAVGKEN
jgi:hypothetical protein